MTPRERMEDYFGGRKFEELEDLDQREFTAILKMLDAAVAAERERCATIALELDIEEFSGRSRENHVRERIYETIMKG